MNNAWSLVLRPKDIFFIGTKWIFKNKMNENGEVTRNKTRLVCKWYAQEEGIDYGETFSLVTRLEGVRIPLAYVAYKWYKLYQKNVKSSILKRILEEEVYIEQIQGFFAKGKKNMVCKLQKALYGLKQAPRAWYERLHSYLMRIGVIRTSENSNLYLKSEYEDRVLLAEIFVDDIIFGANEIIYRTIGTMMETRCKLLKEDDFTEVNETLYRSMISKLLHGVYSRPDIAHVVSIVAIFLNNPKETYMTIVKINFRYM